MAVRKTVRRKKSVKPAEVILRNEAIVEKAIQIPRSLGIAKEGIRTGGDFAQMMSALMSDVIEGNVTPQVANATVNAGGKLLKVVELQLKYGSQPENGQARVLKLV
jgi:hypothetical protein